MGSNDTKNLVFDTIPLQYCGDGQYLIEYAALLCLEIPFSTT